MFSGPARLPAKDDPMNVREDESMRDWRVRLYAPLDIEACRELWADLVETHRGLYEDPSIGGDHPGLCFDRHLKEVGERGLWVAEAKGKAVGLAGLLVRQEGASVEPLVVAKAFQRRGIGRALLSRVLEEARAQGFAMLSVHPVARNREALEFFRACGFAKLGMLELFVDLKPDGRAWKRGFDVHGLEFEY